jgi:succinate dehydrogenase / fumarate reductase cytochrome b subunit
MPTSVIGVRPGKQEERPARFLASTNGKKIVMALTGVILFGFVVAHMLGNLQVYEGPAKINAYGRFLKSVPELLWGVRVTLLVAVVLHIWASIALALRNNAARPKGYARKQNTVSTYASRTMYWSGPLLFCFIVYHLLHFTAGLVHPGSDFVEGDVYHNMVASFSVWYVSAWYIFSMILLGLHVGHGASSFLQSLGFNHPRHTPVIKKAAAIFAVLLIAGFISIPVSVLTGLVK